MKDEKTKNNEFEIFEMRIKNLMKGYVYDVNSIIYLLSYLCYIDLKLSNSANINFCKDETISNFDLLISEIKECLLKDEYNPYTQDIIMCLEYLNELKYTNININSLIKLLGTKTIEFYEEILTSNKLDRGANDVRVRGENTPDEITSIFNFFKKGNSMLDVGSGNGNTLVELSKYNSWEHLDGVEINPKNAFISKLRLNCCDNQKSRIYVDDYFDFKIKDKYSFITINMPLGLNVNNIKRNEMNYNKMKDYMFKWIVTPAMSSEWIYINKALNLLEKNGRIAIVSLLTPLFKTGDLKQREDLIDNNLVEYIIKMPKETYPSTFVSYCIIILNNAKKDDKVRFIDATNCIIQEHRCPKRIDTNKIIELISQDKAIIKSNEEIKSKNYILYSNESLEDKHKIKNATRIENLNIEVNRGYQGFKKEDCTSDGKYSIITISDIDDNGNICDLARFNTSKDLSKYILRKNDILITTKGTKIKTCIVKELANENTVYHGNITLIRIYDANLNPTYLKLYLDSKIGQKELKSIQTGTTIISINSSQLRTIEIPLIPIAEQEKIEKNYNNYKMELDILKKQLQEKSERLDEQINEWFKEEKN